MKRLFLLVFLLVWLVISACALPGMLLGDKGKESPAQFDYIFDIPTDPIRVSPTLDSENGAEAMIPVSGGEMSVTAVDGTIYHLEIPSKALANDTLIRMTPVKHLDGMPFGSETLAVELEPEGLFLFNAATLTIAPVENIPLDQQILIGYQGKGENLTLALPVVDSSEIQIQTMHFSGYGVSKGFLADIEPVRQRIGGDAETRITSAIAEQLQKARQAQLLGQENPEPIDFSNYFQQYEEQVVKPRLAAAGESCAAGRLAIQTVLSYERQKQLLGIESDGEGSLVDQGLLDTVGEVCMKEEYEMCRDDHIIHRIIPAWLGLERQYQLLGISEDGATSPTLEKAKDYVKKCLTFEMRFQSQASFDDGESGGYTSSVESKIKIQFDTADLSMKGQAPLVNTDFEFIAPGCSVENVRGGGTFEAMKLEFILDSQSASDPLGFVRDFKFIYFPGNTSESFTVTCDDFPPYSSPPTSYWTGIYLVLHEGEMSQTDGGFIAENWEIFGDEYFAKIEWIREDSGEGIVEAGTFKLYHTPE